MYVCRMYQLLHCTLDTIRANEITIENSKTGKVTAVVAILKVSKKRARELPDNDSDDKLDIGSSSTGSLVDKRKKSTDSRPTKATKLALDIIRAKEIAIENSETGKVTAVVAISEVILAIHGTLVPGNC